MSELSSLSTDTKAFSSLAVGADQVFANLALAKGLGLITVIPCKGYEDTFETEADLNTYRSLLGSAEKTIELDWPKPTEEAFYAAGKYIAENSDLLIAIWNQKPAQGLGGTGDIVEYANQLGKTVKIFNPEIMSRA